MADASWEVQKAIYTKLKTDLSINVYDNVPSSAQTPYVTIGDDTASDDSTKTDDGQQITLTIHAWSDYAGRKQVKELGAEIYAALHKQPLPVAGFDVREVRWVFGDTIREPDGHTYHGVQRFRVFVQG
ncbi:DUF3168 domain-containing protein [Kiloniella antarctica]|uniref:DUF3168 domain-containing protein n=1 Tax=Kiloniella antarctica TaxID=1550907 RepID=A0ABW5BM92_9PROT